MDTTDAGYLDVLAGNGAPLSGEALKPAQPWIGIHFECCGVYKRIYRNHAAYAYHGACPHCKRSVHVPIGPNGTTQRIFHAL